MRAHEIESVQAYLGALPNGDRVEVQSHGHIVVHTHSRNGSPSHVVFADLVGSLSLWSYQGCELTPELAERLASALTQWAAGAREHRERRHCHA